LAGRGGYLAQVNNLDASAPKRALIPQTLTPHFLTILDIGTCLKGVKLATILFINVAKTFCSFAYLRNDLLSQIAK